MDRPHCSSGATTERSDRTALGYRRFRCRHCDRGFNERTGTPYNWLQYPTAHCQVDGVRRGDEIMAA